MTQWSNSRPEGSPYCIDHIILMGKSSEEQGGIVKHMPGMVLKCEGAEKTLADGGSVDWEACGIDTRQSEVLVLAAYRGLCNVVDSLLSRGELPLSDATLAQQVLCAALLSGCHHCTAALLQAGVVPREVHAATYLSECWRRGTWKSRGSSPSLSYTPVTADTLRLLVGHGALLYRGALFRAARSKDCGAVRTLVKCGVDVNIASFTGMTPLQLTCSQLQIATTAALLSVGAKPQLRGVAPGVSVHPPPLHLCATALTKQSFNRDGYHMLWLLLWAGASSLWRAPDDSCTDDIFDEVVQFFHIGPAADLVRKRLRTVPTLQEAAMGRVLVKLVGERATWRKMKVKVAAVASLGLPPVVARLLEEELRTAGFL